MISEIMDRLAEATPEEMMESLERLVDAGKITMSQAGEAYTASRREQMVRNARLALDNAIEWLVTEYLRAEGHTSEHGKAKRIYDARSHVREAADIYEETVRKAAVTRWRIEMRAS